MCQFTFQIDSRDGRARRGRLFTPRGESSTPPFMPVGTHGPVQAMPRGDVAGGGGILRATRLRSTADGSVANVPAGAFWLP